MKPKYKAHDYIEGAFKYLCLSENRNFEIRELFTYAFINKSNRQKKVNYVKIESNHLKKIPLKILVGDYESDVKPGKHDGLKVVKKIISLYRKKN